MEVVLLGRVRSLGLRLPRTLLDEASEAMARFGIDALAGRALNAVSGVQRQLIFLAQALFSQPQVLLLDEPSAALDLRQQMLVLKAVNETARKHPVIIAIAMHDLSLAAQFADNFILLRGKHVEATGPATTVLVPERLAAAFGVQTEVLYGHDGKPRVMPVRAL